jgi:CheY-like chemotaxis protein
MNHRILLVDDDTPVRLSLSAFLDDCGLQVTAAESAEEALSLLNHSSFDLAVVDLRLPGMSGDMFILKAHEQASEMRFLIHTGSTSYSLSPELREIGIGEEQLLRKPLPDLNRLLEAIERGLQDETT